MMTEALSRETGAEDPGAATATTTAVDDANALPFVAPCRKLGTWGPRWGGARRSGYRRVRRWAPWG